MVDLFLSKLKLHIQLTKSFASKQNRRRRSRWM